MYYSRFAKSQIVKLQRGFPVISVTGPRQSGKTTFLRHQFPHFSYFNLEDPNTRDLIAADPKQFFELHSKEVVIDEVQRLPELLSFIQAHVDLRKEMGSIIISGSQNLLLSQHISQSLAGRAAYQTILPFSLRELQIHNLVLTDRYEQILKGFYPAPYTRDVAPATYYEQYIATYVERDVRLIKNIQDLSQFQKFMRLVAGRVGQVLNLSSLASDTGISAHTAEDWISILEASYIVYRLQPYHGNTGKRLIKSPKVFFYDTGVLCALLKLSSVGELMQHFAIGSIFENFVITEFKKELSTGEKSAEIYFYRDNNRKEIDLIIDTGTRLLPVEIKSAATYSDDFFKAFPFWRKHTNGGAPGFVVYGGLETQSVRDDRLVGWRSLENIFNEIQ